MKPKNPYREFKQVLYTEAERKKRQIDIRRYMKMHRLLQGVSPKEKELLAAKVLLSDGTTGDVVTIGRKRSKWYYFCHVCQFGTGIIKFLRHWESKEHQERLGNPIHPVGQFVVTQTSETCFNTFESQYKPGVSESNERQQPSSQDTVDKVLTLQIGCDGDERKFCEELKSVGNINIWQDYCDQAKEIEANLYNEMMYYKENAKEHHEYKNEWKKFCIERHQQLREGRIFNASYTNIDNEFEIYWELKLRDIFQDAFLEKKAQLRQKLKNNLHNIDIVQTTECSPQESQGVSLGERRFENLDSINEEQKPVSEVTVIYVLRYLSVLEDHLGSLGPKVVDLLSEALLLEKSSNSSLLLSEEENCLLLETAKEKLKGLLQSGLIQQSLISLVESLIKNVTYLINKADSENVVVSFNKSSSSHETLLRHDDEKNSHCGERKSHRDENRLYWDDRNTNEDKEIYYHNERKACEEERKNIYFKDELNSYQEERKTFDGHKSPSQDERKTFYCDKVNTYVNERSSSCDKRKTFYRDKVNTYVNEMSSSCDERKTCNDKIKFYQHERKIYEDKTSSYHDERKIYEDKTSSYHDERKSFNDKINFLYEETKNYNEKKSNDGRDSYGDVMNTQYNEKKLYNDNLSHIEKISDFKRKELSYKASELSTVLKNFRCLLQFSYIEILEMSQKIASSMLLKGQKEITKDELMEVVDTYIREKTEKDKFSSSNCFNIQSKNDFQMKPVTYDQNSSAYPSRDYSSITPFPYKPVNNNSFITSGQGYSDYRQVPFGYNSNYSRPATFYGNFHQSNPYQRY